MSAVGQGLTGHGVKVTDLSDGDANVYVVGCGTACIGVASTKPYDLKGNNKAHFVIDNLHGCRGQGRPVRHTGRTYHHLQ